jgi:hypothetical protein
MIAFGRRETGEAMRRDLPLRDGAIGKKGEWMVSGEDRTFSPTVFLIEQPPGATISAHLHHNNQFQVFIHGGGKIGPRSLDPVTVHYAGAYTAYGPLVAGPEGLHYFTLRTVCERGAILVRNAEGKWPDGPRRHATSKPVGVFDPASLRALSQPATTVVLPQAEDGLAATSTVLPPHGVMPLVEIGAGEGVFLVLLSGSIELAGERLLADESIYLSKDEAFPVIVAGEAGAQLLALVPPQRDPIYPAFG